MTSQSTTTTVPYPGIPVTTNGNQLVSYYTEARLADAGIFYPITPSTEMGENFQLSFAQGQLNVFGRPKVAVETEGEHAAQGGAIAYSLTGKRVVNFTSGQGVAYGIEQYYHAPGKLSTMVLEVAARAMTKHALNVHCGHDDIYLALDTGWIILFGKDAQQASDQALILRRVTETALTPGINGQDGFLTSHLERTFLKPEAGLIREFLGHPEDLIDCPTEAQRELFGPRRRRVPAGMDLARPAVLGTVQNQEHYMQGVAARRHHFVEPILGFLEQAYEEFARLTGRRYGLLSANQCDDADTVFLSIGSAAENIDAAIDYIRATRGEKVGSIHLNVVRPFPEAAVIEALRGKQRVIVLERIDDQTAGENPLARDIRTALGKALENSRGAAHAGLPALTAEELPRIFSGTYGLGSRDFRPEGILGAYEFATGKIAREDGRRASDGESFFYVGIPHPYAVVSEEAPSLLPESAIAIRFHSIGGWGMITTGKNMGEILGALGSYVAHRDDPQAAAHATAVHISANPKYGSEKKGAPTAYFLVAAGERVRTNCDLRHVDVVLCCDPKVFLHTNPLNGLNPGGAFVWESNETTDEGVWSRIPARYRQEIIDKQIRIFALNGFAIARAATERPDLQYRMQGNSFLGAFFRVSSFLADHHIPEAEFLTTVREQYVHKFGRFGDAVVESNMTVMNEGYSQVREIQPGAVDAPDRSAMRGPLHLPSVAGKEPERDPGLKALAPVAAGGVLADSLACALRPALFARSDYDAQFRADYGYDVPSTPRAATGMMAAGTGATIGKYVARRLVPKFIAENCTQCMACITACPDTALPNTAQDLDQILRTLFGRYVTDGGARALLQQAIPELETELRAEMLADAGKKGETPRAFATLVMAGVRPLLEAASDLSAAVVAATLDELEKILRTLPIAYANVRMIFSGKEKKQPGSGGVFAIFVSDHCKGCGECVEECGDHEALVMVEEDEEIYADHETAIHFLDLLPETPRHYLGQYDPDHPEEAKAAALHFHLMQQNNYRALVSGDGACAGCGEKSVLRAATTITEATMRPIFHRKAERLAALAEEVAARGLQALRAADGAAAANLRLAITHLILGFGGENRADTEAVIAAGFDGSDEVLVETLRQVLAAEAFNHRELQAIEGGPWNGMSVMAMAASTGCNTVYGSTHPNNPHPYPWVNSLFQDGATVGWLLAEGFMAEHIRRSVLPERLARALLSGNGLSEDDYQRLTLLTDASLSDQEVLETPKVWAIGGDGAFGDIGFQNLSKAVLQNRPNLQILMLDTQVYSNTGGQNSDSSPMPGGFDMNQAGAATEGKLTEKKGVAECFTSGHGSPYVAQVSMGSAATLFRALLEGIFYRGTAFFQCFTTCQPEHGVGDDVAALQAQRARDSRGVPEFIFDPQKGETYADCFSLKGNPGLRGDWQQVTVKATKERYAYTVAHWAYTEARFRRHFHKVDAATMAARPNLDTLLALVTQNDVTHRYFQDPEHRAFVPLEGSWTLVQGADGKLQPIGISRQLVLFCVERRKSWRMLQSKAGIRNLDQAAQARLIAEYEQGKIPLETLRARATELLAVARKQVQSGDKGALLELLD